MKKNQNEEQNEQVDSFDLSGFEPMVSHPRLGGADDGKTAEIRHALTRSDALHNRILIDYSEEGAIPFEHYERLKKSYEAAARRLGRRTYPSVRFGDRERTMVAGVLFDFSVPVAKKARVATPVTEPLIAGKPIAEQVHASLPAQAKKGRML